MTNIIQFPIPIPMTNGNYPQFKFAIFGDNLATVTTAGYLNQANAISASPLSSADVIMALYSFNIQTQSGIFDIFTVSIAAATGVITLSEWNSTTGGSVTLPTIANYISHFTNATGNMSSNAANITNAGNIQAGLSGTAGILASFPATASKGSLILAGVANTGNTNTTISNVAMGQASVISIPDPAQATSSFILADSSGTQIINTGNFAVAAGTINATTGNIAAGSSGNAGIFGSYPPTAARGELQLAAVNNTGNTITTISNAAMGQTSTISIPDPGGATANFVIAPSALVSGNLVKASGTAGLIVDAGFAIHAATTASYAGGGTSNVFVTTNMTASSIVTATILSQTNAASIVKAVPGTNTLTVTFSADPGASTTVSWISVTPAG